MGQVTTDFDGSPLRLCPENTPEFTYGLRKEKDGTESDGALTSAQWDDLVQKSNNASQFDTAASAAWGSWYDDLPETSEDPAKDNCRKFMKRVKDSG